MNKLVSAISALVVALLALSVVACDSNGDVRRLSNLVTTADAGFTRILINGDTDTVIETGQSTQLSLTAFTEDGLTGTVINAGSADWSTSNRLIAEIDPNTGIVLGGSVDGEVVITASFGNLVATVQVRVSSAQLESIIIESPAASLNECSANQFVALGQFQGEIEQRDITDSVVWSVAESSAVFDGVGLLRVAGAGDLTVTATRAAFLSSSGLTQTDTVTVLDNLTGIDVIAESGELAVRSPLQYRAFPIYEGLPDERSEITDNVVWSIVDGPNSPGFADVDVALPATGLVSADRAGNGVLSATCLNSGISQSVNITAVGTGEFAELSITPFNPAREFPLQVTWLGEEITEQLVATALFLDQAGGIDVTDNDDTLWEIETDTNNVFVIGNEDDNKGELLIRGTGTVTVIATFIDENNDDVPFSDRVTIVSQ